MKPENWPDGNLPVKTIPSSNRSFKSPTNNPEAEFGPILAVNSIDPHKVYPFPSYMNALMGG
jgi:hypothetical protein